MEYTIVLNEQQLEVLKTIFAQIAPTPIIVTPVSKPKKPSKIEQTRQSIRDYRANKASRKRKK